MALAVNMSTFPRMCPENCSRIRLFDKHWDWKDITSDKILERFKHYGYVVSQSYFKNDRFYVYTF